MQKMRNRRRLSRIIDKLVTIAFWLVLLYAIAEISSVIQTMRAIQMQMLPRGSSVTTHSFLPGDYSERAYQVALQRYDIEHGYILPDDYTEN